MKPARIAAAATVAVVILLTTARVMTVPAVPLATTDPDFFWLPPTIPLASSFTGPFDPLALDALVVEVCELEDDGHCADGPPVARFTPIDGAPPNRLRLEEDREFYSVIWMPGRDHLDPDGFYRVRVLRADAEVGTLNLQVVGSPAALRSVDATRFVGITRGRPFTIQFRVQHPTARTRVRINEVESNNGVPGDWIELHNSASVPLSLAGYVVKDSDDEHVMTFPDGLTVPANGYHVIEESALGFGLGGADAVRLFTPDEKVLVDAYAWATHAATTYGRCPDGSGDPQVTTTPTKNGPNDCRPTVVINEVQPDASAGGSWLELYNPGPGPAQLGGFVLRDSLGASGVMPKATLAAGNYLVLEVSMLPFQLTTPGGLQLLGADGALLDSVTWTTHVATSHGRCPSGTGALSTTLGATKGGANQCFVPVTTLHINEVESNGGVPGDWVELVNSGSSTINLSGWQIVDNDDSHTRLTLPDNTTIAPGGYLLIEEDALGFGLGAGDSVRLFDPLGMLYESFTWTTHAATTYGRCPSATGAFRVTTASTKGGANDCSLLVRVNEVESNGGTPGDWIELFNAGPSPADLQGFVVRDNDDAHSYVLPAGSLVGPGEYLVVEEAALGFGLGAADSARLFDSTGALVDAYAWTAHATTTYGRCPNGSGAFATTTTSTKGAANSCTAPVTTVHINEVESNGGTPGDWFELVNVGTTPVDLSGWRMLDNDDAHARYVFPAGTVIAPNGYLVIEEAAFGFGLGAADSVRIFDAGDSLYEVHSWTAHAPITYARCPNGTGEFTASTSSTKGAPNDCGNPVRINEIESNGGVPGDWIELFNPSPAPVDLSGVVVSDNDDTHLYVIPAGTTIAAGGYHVVEESALGFGLGAADSARLFDSAGSLLDSYAWTAHATTTYGRCPNGSGPFTTTSSVTKGVVNTCPGDALPWPGATAVQTADGAGVLGGNMSGLAYEGSGSDVPGVLWAVRNGPGSLFRLTWNGSIWTPDTTAGWSAGKTLLYPNGGGSPDAEGVTFTAGGPLAGLYAATERDNNASGISRNSILRFEPGGTGTTLTATHEWNLTADLPVVGANLGMEAITWIPDTFLVANAFFDESKGRTYNPADYPTHGEGLFFVGIEANGQIVAYALGNGGTFTRIATITSGLAGVMDLHFDRETLDLWAVCDDTCNGRMAVLAIDGTTKRFVTTRTFERPASMPNLNNEGFTIAPLSECASGVRPAFWTDDSATDGHAIRKTMVSCTPVR